MLLSRTLARARIARGERPGPVAAWGPVAADFACVAGAILLGLSPALRLVEGWPLAASLALFFLLFYVPAQAVLIVSALWAARSRWDDGAGPG